MPNILIVEDDIALNNGIVLSLRQESFSFLQAFTIKQADQFLVSHEIDLIILDINLPDGNGAEWCGEIRKTSAVPILMLTANDMEIDVVTGFELGADDYMTKPFSLMILRARVAALLRRAASDKGVTSVLRIDDFSFNFDEMEFTNKGQQVVLSKTEQKLLRLLVLNKGITVSRATLIDKIWTDGTEYVDENALSVTISRLRNKLEEVPAAPRYIQTVYGIGYTWAVK
ncbi:response regulator transcription factor [Paenibacillus sp. FSL R5-0470]|uniref:response regulator transcription factor n=1 Tax=Paenibacillus sp. FSL R5-0470 TaxID=2921641 RepID=UPI0030D9DFFB